MGREWIPNTVLFMTLMLRVLQTESDDPLDNRVYARLKGTQIKYAALAFAAVTVAAAFHSKHRKDSLPPAESLLAYVSRHHLHLLALSPLPLLFLLLRLLSLHFAVSLLHPRRGVFP